MKPSRLFFATALLSGLSAAAQLPLPPPPPDPLHLTAQFLKLDPPRLPGLGSQVKAPDVDLPIALWISSRAKITPEVVIQAHLGGLDWLSVFIKFHVPMETLIVPVQSKCPPYGKAWGYRRNHGGEAAVRFTDLELAEFVHVRAINGIYGTPFTEIVSNRCAGRGMHDIIVGAHEKKHGKGRGPEGHGPPPGKGRGHDEGGDNPGQGKGKGHGKGHGG